VLTGFISAYYFIWHPIEEAKRSGVLRQGVYGLFIPILLLCAGVATLATDLRDEKSLWVGPDGKLWWTRRARLAIYGMWGATFAFLGLWYIYGRSIGLEPLKALLSGN
jgi:hypothetical protein